MSMTGLLLGGVSIASPLTARAQDLDCNDFTWQNDAQNVLDQSGYDVHGLDRDNDGIACESLPYRSSGSSSGSSALDDDVYCEDIDYDRYGVPSGGGCSSGGSSSSTSGGTDFTWWLGIGAVVAGGWWLFNRGDDPSSRPKTATNSTVVSPSVVSHAIPTATASRVVPERRKRPASDPKPKDILPVIEALLTRPDRRGQWTGARGLWADLKVEHAELAARIATSPGTGLNDAVGVRFVGHAIRYLGGKPGYQFSTTMGVPEMKGKEYKSIIRARPLSG